MFVFEQLIVFYPELVRELNFLWLFSEHFHIISTHVLYQYPGFFQIPSVLLFHCALQPHIEKKNQPMMNSKGRFFLSPGDCIQLGTLTFVKLLAHSSFQEDGETGSLATKLNWKERY